MNGTVSVKNAIEETFYLTELLGARVRANGRRVGKLKDVVAVDQGKLAEVTHLMIGRLFGDPPLLVPLSKVRSFGLREVVVEDGDPDSYVRALQPEEVLLRDYLLDKKVLDMEDREVEVVYDIRLVRTNGKMYVSDVDISRYGLLRQLGFKGLANHFYQRASETKKRLIPWSYVQALPPHLGALEGNLKLNVLKEELAEIHPVDLADILEELDSSQRATIMEGLDTEQASDTLEEVEPAVQRDIVRSLRKDRVAELIGEMTPGQAADILSVLPAEDKKAILKLLEPSQVAKIEQILEEQDISINSFATPRFFKFPPDITAEQAQRKCRELAKHTEVVMYLYIVNPKDRLVGVAAIKDLFMAEDNELLGDLMVKNIISLSPASTLKEAVDLFNRYHFEALPVVGVTDIIMGVVPYRDVMNLKHRVLE